MLLYTICVYTYVSIYTPLNPPIMYLYLCIPILCMYTVYVALVRVVLARDPNRAAPRHRHEHCL